MAQGYVRNHIVTEAYLRGFCDDDGRGRRVEPHRQSVRRLSNSVGYRKWSFGDDDALRAEVEQKLSAVEHRLAGIRDDVIRGPIPATQHA